MQLLDQVAPELEAQMRRRILDEAVGNPLALVELPRALRQASDSQKTAPHGMPLTDRLERTFPDRPQHSRVRLSPLSCWSPSMSSPASAKF